MCYSLLMNAERGSYEAELAYLEQHLKTKVDHLTGKIALLKKRRAPIWEKVLDFISPSYVNPDEKAKHTLERQQERLTVLQSVQKLGIRNIDDGNHTWMATFTITEGPDFKHILEINCSVVTYDFVNLDYNQSKIMCDKYGWIAEEVLKRRQNWKI